MGAGGGAGGHRFARRGFGGDLGGLRVQSGCWRGWGEARNRHGDRGRGCSEMAPGRELKAAGGGAGCPVPERGARYRSGAPPVGQSRALGTPRALLGVCGLRARGAYCL